MCRYIYWHAFVILCYIKATHKSSFSFIIFLISRSDCVKCLFYFLFGAFMLNLALTLLLLQPGSVLIIKGQEEVGRDQTLSRVIQPPHPPHPPTTKPHYDGNARRTSPSTGNKGAAGQEGEFPCKKCGRSVVGKCQHCCVGDDVYLCKADNSYTTDTSPN